jgi:hypothetical protein
MIKPTKWIAKSIENHHRIWTQRDTWLHRLLEKPEVEE